MRILLAAAVAALTVPAWTVAAGADGLGTSGQQTTSTTQTTTTKSQDGDTTTTTTTTKSETTSSGGGFSLGGFFSSNGHSGVAPTYDTIGGSWKIGEAGGSKICDLTLEKTKFISNYGARTGIGCPEGLFGVSSWLLAGDEVRLMSPGGSLLAKLHPAGSGRWNGKTEAGLEIFMTRN
jgi:hypothetical protein